MHTLPELPYPADALEPHIDAATMELHHGKHHKAYVDKLNAALEGNDEFTGLEIGELLNRLDELPESIRTTVRNNGGGHANHSLFWVLMSPEGGGEPQGALAAKIDSTFGSFHEFQTTFKEAAIGRFGSGWAWLVKTDDGTLQVISTANQDSPVMDGNIPLLGLDVWEHAYYLNYQNKRPDYVDAWWQVVNWREVERRYGA